MYVLGVGAIYTRITVVLYYNGAAFKNIMVLFTGETTVHFNSPTPLNKMTSG